MSFFHWDKYSRSRRWRIDHRMIDRSNVTELDRQFLINSSHGRGELLLLDLAWAFTNSRTRAMGASTWQA
eukprot:scaffold470_cov98-Cylindrotheca_fusiformis.AAC.4